MGEALRRAAHSPNIKERRDYSCAVFDAQGRLLAQAAHIPVHLGALPASVAAARAVVGDEWSAGDVIVLNDPFHGGSHLPDVTTVSPVFDAHPRDEVPRPRAFLATRAHHADVGGSAPGSMAMTRDLFAEGLIVPPVFLRRRGILQADIVSLFAANSRTPAERRGDLAAQLGAHHVGEARLRALLAGGFAFEEGCDALLDWSNRLGRARLQALPAGEGFARGTMEDDGLVDGPFEIRAHVHIDAAGGLRADFRASDDQVGGGINAPRAVTVAAVRYALACLLPDVPLNDGSLSLARVQVRQGSLLDPYPGAAVAAGNVETSQRVVDVLFAAIDQAIPGIMPASSQGSMNNVLAGGSADVPGTTGAGTGSRADWAYYETMGGGGGGGPMGPGSSGRQCHMTNTFNTPVEALELSVPLRVASYRLRAHSGGAGRHRGGEGVERALQFLAPARVTLVTERRRHGPPGLAGGSAGEPGQNVLVRAAESQPIVLPAKTSLDVEAGDTLIVRSPGGGGWGCPDNG